MITVICLTQQGEGRHFIQLHLTEDISAIPVSTTMILCQFPTLAQGNNVRSVSGWVRRGGEALQNLRSGSALSDRGIFSPVYT